MLIRVSLISDYQLIAWAISQVLDAMPGRFQFLASAQQLEAASVEAVIQTQPDVILLDIDSDPQHAIPIVTALCQAARTSKILILTRLDDHELQDAAVLKGARGVLKKDCTPRTLVSAIERVHEGQLWLDRNATGRVFVELSRQGDKPAVSLAQRQLATLTERERQIVQFVAAHSGDPGKALARKMQISESTLRNHLTAIYEKLGVANRHGLVAYAFQNGLQSQPA